MTRQTLALTVATASALGASVCSATVYNTARVTVSPNFSGGSGPIDLIVDQAGTADATGSATGGFSSSGSAIAHTEYGYIRTSGQAVGSLNAGASGIIRDNVTINAPGFPMGTLCVITYSVRVQGTLQATSGSSASRWSLHADIGGGVTDISRTATQYSPELAGGAYTGDPFGTYSVSVQLQMGFSKPFYLDLSTVAQAANSGLSSGHAVVPPSVELFWEGVQSVTINGTPVTNFTISSESGTNWAGPFSRCGSADFNGDGDTGTDADIEAFFACLGGNCCPTCGSADFNGDGDTGTDADIEAFFSVLGGGGC